MKKTLAFLEEPFSDLDEDLVSLNDMILRPVGWPMYKKFDGLCNSARRSRMGIHCLPE